MTRRVSGRTLIDQAGHSPRCCSEAHGSASGFLPFEYWPGTAVELLDWLDACDAEDVFPALCPLLSLTGLMLPNALLFQSRMSAERESRPRPAAAGGPGRRISRPLNAQPGS